MPSFRNSSSTDSSESGNAMIEFLGLGFMLMVPTIYFLLAVFAVQSGSMAASAAADQAAQTIANQPLDSLDPASVTKSAEFAATDYGVEASQLTVNIQCAGGCTDSDSVRVNTSVTVRLPLIPWVKSASIAEVESSSSIWGGRYR